MTGKDKFNKDFPLASHFRVKCMCPKNKCHNVVFGKLCQLHIVHKVFHIDVQLSLSAAEKIFNQIYSDVLQFKIFKSTNRLDVKWCQCIMSDCVHVGSLEQSLIYIQYSIYHYHMHQNITVGRYGFSACKRDFDDIL